MAALAEGGSVLMPLDAYPWSDRYAWVQDRFGFSWQVMLGWRDGQTAVVPCLMFTDANQGKAQDAMDLCTRLFPDSRVTRADRYPAEEDPQQGIKHARFVLAGQDFAAMDSPIEHGFAFNEGVSFQVLCETQQDVDRYWDALSAVPDAELCGWLKDRFGVSWQIVPTVMLRLLADADRGKTARAMAAMMRMRRSDIPTLQTVAEG